MTEKSDRVQRLMDDPDLKEAFANVRDRLLSAFSSCDCNDTEMMKDIRKRLFLLDLVEKDLMSAIQDGTLEDFHMAEQERPGFLEDLTKWKRKNRAYKNV